MNMLNNRHPVKLFLDWFDQAKAMKDKIDKPESFILSTVDQKSKKFPIPNARVLLFKGIVADQYFSFYTNYHSQKGQELEQVPYAAMTFFWDPIGYQVRIQGNVSKLSRQESVDYFNSRPLDSQKAAMISLQSQKIPHGVQLDELAMAIKDEEVQCPEDWGGYKLDPEKMEFWINGKNRLHNRSVFTYDSTLNRWNQDRLYP